VIRTSRRSARALALSPIAAATLAACAAATPPPSAPSPAASAASAKPSIDPALVDDCAPSADGTPAKPLRITYEGLAKKARCDREVYTIMGGVVASLGVKCEYCHLPNKDYITDTPKKRIANWMATDFVPALAAKDGKPVWCWTCHRASGTGIAKLLGDPRTRERANEWMTSVMYEKLVAKSGQPLRCAACHQAQLDSDAFQKQIILHSERLPK
jgi:hypothetical protein